MTDTKKFKTIYQMIKKGAFTVPLEIAQQTTNKTLTMLIQENIFPIADAVYEKLEHEGAGAFLRTTTDDGTMYYILIVHVEQKGGEMVTKLAFPGGRAKEGETPLQTRVREVFEETKLDVTWIAPTWCRYAMGDSGARADTTLIDVPASALAALGEAADAFEKTYRNVDWWQQKGAVVADIVLVPVDAMHRYLRDERMVPTGVSVGNRVRIAHAPLRPWNYTAAKLHLLD